MLFTHNQTVPDISCPRISISVIVPQIKVLSQFENYANITYIEQCSKYNDSLNLSKWIDCLIV